MRAAMSSASGLQPATLSTAPLPPPRVIALSLLTVVFAGVQVAAEEIEAPANQPVSDAEYAQWIEERNRLPDWASALNSPVRADAAGSFGEAAVQPRELQAGPSSLPKTGCYMYEADYNSTALLNIPNCTCHESCIACGFSIDLAPHGRSVAGQTVVLPTGPDNCITCATPKGAEAGDYYIHPQNQRSGHVSTGTCEVSPDWGWPVWCKEPSKEQPDCVDDECSTSQICVGSQEQWMKCDPLPPACPEDDASCKGKKAVDCVFNEWGDWGPDGCSGLCKRMRQGLSPPDQMDLKYAIATVNSCGGSPCSGDISETAEANEFCTVMCQKEQDCSLATWSDWAECGTVYPHQRGRSRSIHQHQRNGGKACKGDLFETQACDTDPSAKVEDCQVNHWLEWSPCSRKCGGGRRERQRMIAKKAQNGGLLCTLGEDPPCVRSNCKVLGQVEACSSRRCEGDVAAGVTKDCELGPWQTWSGCAGGSLQKYRERIIHQPAMNGGKSCPVAELQMTAPCKERLTDAQEADLIEADCTVTPWSDWQLCSKTCNGGQTYRTREIEQPKVLVAVSVACTQNLTETRPCNTHIFSHLIVGRNCHASKWAEWGACSAKCGNGHMERTRQLLRLAHSGGFACGSQDTPRLDALDNSNITNFDLTTYKSCSAPACISVDCVWKDWSDWSECSKKFGGGQQGRSRTFLEHKVGTGQDCDPKNSSQEIRPCNTDHIEWQDWGPCSVSCGEGIRTRSREPKTRPNECGNPLEGSLIMYDKCVLKSCHHSILIEDCSFSAWAQWSDCSCTCNGYSTRTRTIRTYPSPDGANCKGSTKELQSCKLPHEGAVGCGTPASRDCLLSQWTPWQGCSLPCGGGQQNRQRQVDVIALGTGKLCNDNLEETQGCNSVSCLHDIDCVWSPWSDWGACSQPGQRNRPRHVLTHAKEGGKPCAAQYGEETQECARADTHIRFCIWAEWGPWSECDVSCGHGNKKRTMVRQISDQASFKFVPEHSEEDIVIAKGGTCTGHISSVDKCENKACSICTLRDCSLGPWMDWGDVGCDKLCHRIRNIAQKQACHGKFCAGKLRESKDCAKEMPQKCISHQDQDCSFGDWEDWSETQCKIQLDAGAGEIDGVNGNYGQKYRQRRFLPPRFDGKPCLGTLSHKPWKMDAELNQTMPCRSEASNTRDCKFARWGNWSACSATCGDGQCSRTRVIDIPAALRGRPCNGAMSMTRPCAKDKCPIVTDVDCTLSGWSEWTMCDNPQESQSYRERSISQNQAGDGTYCKGEMKQTMLCPAIDSVKGADCVFSSWSMWSDCDSQCNGGQRYRERMVNAPARQHGKPCIGELTETEPCNEKPCTHIQDCLVSVWSDWGECSPTCGQGYKVRDRHIERPAQRGGKGCTDKLRQVAGCKNADCPGVHDCKWDAWVDWGHFPDHSTFTCKYPGNNTCGVGYVLRKRELRTFPEGPSAALCKPGSILEAENLAEFAKRHCKVDHCCKDGVWGVWSDWSSCSASCGGGTMSRSRDEKVKTSSCGNPPQGRAMEYGGCNQQVSCDTDQDCKFKNWSDWSTCTDVCNGHQRRNRYPSQPVSGLGQACNGSLQEVRRCNPMKGGARPARCKLSAPIDCVLSPWVDWSDCSVTCAKGYQTRSRTIDREPTHHGKACEPSLMDIAECFTKACWTKEDGWYETSNCTWEEWQEWAKCDGNQQMRTRQTKYPGHRTRRSGGQNPPNPWFSDPPKRAPSGTPGFKDAVDMPGTQEDKKAESLNTKDNPGTKEDGQDINGLYKNRRKDCQGVRQESRGCFSTCQPTKRYCMWAAWAPWSDCLQGGVGSKPVPCGLGGHRYRRRTLAMQASYRKPDVLEPAGLASVPVDVLERRVEESQRRRLQTIAVSFACGCVAFLIVAVAVRFVWSQRAVSSEYAPVESSESRPNAGPEESNEYPPSMREPMLSATPSA